MGGTPFHTELVAYSQLMDVKMSPWDVSLLRQLYRLNMRVLENKSANPQTPTIDASDGGAVAGMLRGRGTRKAKK